LIELLDTQYGSAADCDSAIGAKDETELLRFPALAVGRKRQKSAAITIKQPRSEVRDP